MQHKIVIKVSPVFLYTTASYTHNAHTSCITLSVCSSYNNVHKDLFLIIPLGHISEPSISSVEVIRLNRTTFNFSVSLAYTGGGAITYFRISLRNTRTASWHSLGKIPAAPSPDCSLVWNGVMSRKEFDTSIPLTFNVIAVNTYTWSCISRSTGEFCIRYAVVINKHSVVCVYCYQSTPSFLFLLTPQLSRPSILVPLLIPVCHPHSY